MAPWEWLILVALILLVAAQVILALTGRPGISIPGWVDEPKRFPSR
jgi:hypothetical protein